MVEVLELHPLKSALAQRVVAEQTQSHLVAQVRIGGEDGVSLVAGEGRAMDGALLRPLDRERGVAVQMLSQYVELEEVAEDREVLVVRASRSRASSRLTWGWT